MKKLKLLVLSITFLFLTLTITACGGKDENVQKIESLISELQYACNNLDVDQLLECIDPNISDPIRLGMSFLGNSSGLSKEEMVEALFDEIGGNSYQVQENPSDFLSTLKINVMNIEVEGDEAMVQAEVSFTVNGEEFDRETYFYCVKELDNWYVADFQFK